MKKLLFLALILGSLSLTTSCSDDYEPAPPIITYPDNGTTINLVPGESTTFSFSVQAPRGYGSHMLTWSPGSVIENTSVIAQGETSFTVSGQFTAGDIYGPGGISLAVTDTEGSSSFATIAVVVVTP